MLLFFRICDRTHIIFIKQLYNQLYYRIPYEINRCVLKVYIVLIKARTFYLCYELGYNIIDKKFVINLKYFSYYGI